MRIALGFMLSLCALLLVGGAAWQRLHPGAAVVPKVPTIVDLAIQPTYVVEPPRPVAPAAPRPPRAAAPTPHAAANLPTHVIKDELATPTPLPTLEAAEVPPGLAPTGPAADEAGPGSPGDAAAEGASVEAGDGPAVAGPYLVVEKMPEFRGGTEALMRYLRSHLRYPGAALAAQAEGRVYVSFVVQADGSIAEVSVPKGLGYGLDEEAQRVVRQMPTWTPGQQSKHAVAVRFTLPITFRIQ